jgi:2-desacetyl-2-hydroxyethyl bacteriochlorophyllide A dehydrogenase
MLEIVLKRPGQFVAGEAPSPRPAPGEALVRVRRIGVCGTDLHAFAGRQPFFEYPRILGHELGVEVIEVAPAEALSTTSVREQDGAASQTTSLRPGDRCAIEPYLRCGGCRACRSGRYNCCETLRCLGVHVDGGMRQLLRVPVELLHKSDKLSLDQLALVETLGIGAHAVARGGLRQGESALVVGAGPIGLAVAQFALLAGGQVQVLEPNAARRDFAARFGVTTLAVPDGALFDVVFDATGNAAAMAASLASVAHGGRLVFVGLVLGTVAIDDPLLHRREITLYASRNSAHDFPRIMRAIEEGRIDTRPWITHRLALANVPEEFAALRESPGLIKAMIEVE